MKQKYAILKMIILMNPSRNYVQRGEMLREKTIPNEEKELKAAANCACASSVTNCARNVSNLTRAQEE